MTLTLLRTEFDNAGNRIDVYRTNEMTLDSCPLCAAGDCEQEVHRSEAYSGDVIVHDRPKVTN